MLSASPTTLAKSSLEEMLDSLRRRDEAEKPKDLPPALPSRPTSKAARLPSVRRSLPTNFKVDENGRKCGENSGGLSEVKGKEEGKRKEKELGVKGNSFGSKKMRKDVNVDSPYNLDAVGGNKGEESEGEERVSDAKVEMKEGGKGKVDWEENDSIGYFIKKVSVLVEISIFVFNFVVF